MAGSPATDLIEVNIIQMPAQAAEEEGLCSWDCSECAGDIAEDGDCWVVGLPTGKAHVTLPVHCSKKCAEDCIDRYAREHAGMAIAAVWRSA